MFIFIRKKNLNTKFKHMQYLIGVIITFFLAFLLITKSNKTLADRILFFWLIGIGFHLYLFYLSFTGQSYNYPYLLGFVIPLPLIHGPFLYLYTASVTNQLSNIYKNILHFFPVLISYISLSSFFQLPSETKIQVFENEGLGYETLLLTNLIATYLSGIIYVIWSFFLLKRHKSNIMNTFSYTERINLYWLRYLVYGIGILWLFVIIGEDELLFSITVVFVIFIGYFGINQVGIFTKKKYSTSNEIVQIEKTEKRIIERESNNDNENNTRLKYEKSGLSNETAIEIHQLLTNKMKEKQLFINPEITLIELAEILNVHPNNLSQVINTFENKNFYDFINTKRIELFLTLIAKPENKKFTILSIAFDCGFNSKSSFNKYFKKETNLTPSEYIKSIT